MTLAPSPIGFKTRQSLQMSCYSLWQQSSLYISRDQSGTLHWCRAPLTPWRSTYLHNIADKTLRGYCEVSHSSDTQTLIRHMHAETHRYVKWMQIVPRQVDISAGVHGAHTLVSLRSSKQLLPFPESRKKRLTLHRIYLPTSWKAVSKPFVSFLCNYLNPRRIWEGFEGNALLEWVVQGRHWQYLLKVKGNFFQSSLSQTVWPKLYTVVVCSPS